MLGSRIASAALPEFCVNGASRATPAGSLGWHHASLDLLDESATHRLLDEIRPHIVVHCAALTDVDQCEQEPDLARRLNVSATERLACWASQNDSKMVYVSSDSVFDGHRGRYCEEDCLRPLNEYASSKTEAEKATLRCSPDALIVRTNFFGRNKGGRPNIGKWMHERLIHGEALPAFEDVRFSPLFVEDLARLIIELMTRNARGTFHVAARDSCTKYEFAQRLARALHRSASQIKPSLIEQAGFRARRPRDTSLCVTKCEEFLGRELPRIEEGIVRFAEVLAANGRENFSGTAEGEHPVAMNAP